MEVHTLGEINLNTEVRAMVILLSTHPGWHRWSYLASSSWYSTTVGPGWSEGVVTLSTVQSDEFGSIPVNVELLSCVC